MIRRPDEEVIEIIAESDKALAQIVQYLAAKVDSIEELALEVSNPSQTFDLGSIIGQMITRNMNSQNSQNIYGRSERGEFDGTQEIIETPVIPEEILELNRDS